MFSPLEQFDAIKLISFYRSFIFFSTFEISLFNIIVPFLLIIFFFSVFLSLLKTNLMIFPNIVQIIFENIIIFIFNLIKHK